MKVLYLAPKPSPLNGISQYATLLTAAMQRYAPEIALQRVDETEFEHCYRNLPRGSVVMAEMSVGEGKVFQVLRQQKHHRPDLRRLITLHDPPRFAVELTPLLQKMSANTLTRALRRAFLDTLGWTVEQTSVLPTDVFLCLSPLGKQVLEQKFKRFFPFVPKVVYMPHLLYLDPPECATAPESSVPTLGYFGYINPHKGVHLLLQAVRSLKARNEPCPHLVIYGEPITRKGIKYYQRLQAFIAKHRLEESVQLQGYLPECKIPQFLRSLDALAMPYFDLGLVSASGVLQWARSVGVPVLASKTRALASLVADNIEGKVVSSYRVSEWAKAMRSIVEERYVWRRFRSGVVQARKHAEWKAIAAALSRVLQDIQRT